MWLKIGARISSGGNFNFKVLVLQVLSVQNEVKKYERGKKCKKLRSLVVTQVFAHKALLVIFSDHLINKNRKKVVFRTKSEKLFHSLPRRLSRFQTNKCKNMLAEL